MVDTAVRRYGLVMLVLQGRQIAGKFWSLDSASSQMSTVLCRLTSYSAFCLPYAQVTRLLNAQEGLVDAANRDLVWLCIEVLEGDLDELYCKVNTTTS